MAIFKCKMCGGTIEFEQGATIGVCDSCGTKQTLPRLDDDRRANMYDRANHFRRNSEYDKAAGIYEQILDEDNTDAEAYWSLILCRYGVEYVEDPATHTRVPTVNRAQYTSIFDDDNYKSALKYSDSFQRELYAKEAVAINNIQKGILAVSQKEEPFDVFICYKETDAAGRRTRDSVLANDLYHQLTQEGLRVFYSRITLEDKLGAEYEPYIFAALNSSKVMVVLGTRPEYFNAAWVKNEWSRFLALVKESGGKKVLIPAFRDMDPYDLPDEFSHLQAQDMSKLGFMQDLIRGIKKIVDSGEQASAPGQDYAENTYLSAVRAMSSGNYDEAVKLFAPILEYKDSYAKSEQCKRMITEASNRALYDRAINLYKTAATEADYRNVANLMNKLGGYKDSAAVRVEALKQAQLKQSEEIYLKACSLINANNLRSLSQADKLLAKIPNYKDAQQKRAYCGAMIKKQQEELAARNAQIWEHRKKVARTVIIICAAALVTTVIIIIAAISIYRSMHSAANVVIDIKNTTSKYEGDYYVYMDYFLQNNTSATIDYVAVTVYFSDKNGKSLGWVTSEFGAVNTLYSSDQTLELKPGKSITKSAYLIERRLESSNEMFKYLYHNGVEDLEITYKITKIKWSDGYTYKNN